MLRSALGLVAASRAALGGKQAFMDASKYLVGNMLKSITKKLEIEMLYGQSGYGVVGSVSGSSVVISTAEWAPGIWAGSEGLSVEIRDTTGATSRGEFKITAVDMDTRTLTFDISASGAGVVATDVLWHKGAYGNEFPGIKKILTNTGTLFNISASTYNLWKGNSYSASSAALSFNKIGKALTRAVEKGADGKMLCLVNPRGWQDIMNDQAALRRYDGSYSSAKMTNGSKGIEFHSQNGVIEIEPSLYVKEGEAFLLSIDEFARVGSSDVTFKRPGREGDFFREMENQAGYELRLYTDQAVICMAPGKNVLITSIVNAS